MLMQQTIEKLTKMKLYGMIEALEEQYTHPSSLELTFEERFSILVEKQYLCKENRALATRLRNAKLKVSACIEDVNYRHKRSLDSQLFRSLSTCQWIRYHQNCIITGPSGCGKTWLACALAQKACRDGYRTLYFYAPKLFRQLVQARADGSFNKFLNRLGNTNLLVIDDWAIHDINEDKCRDFLEILDDRYGTGSLCITSQFPTKLWYEYIGNKTLADAILDRIIHSAHRFELDGESIRKEEKEDLNAAE